MRSSRLAAVITATLIAAGGVLAVPTGQAAHAATHPTGTTATAKADILGVDASAVGISLADVLLGHADAGLRPHAEAASTATGANLGAAVAGLQVPIATNQQTAPPDNPAASAQQLAAVNLLGAVTAGVAESSAHARWAEACTADGQSATSTTSLARADVSLLGIGVATLGASQVTTQTALTGEGVTSTSVGSITGLTLLDGAVSVAVDGTATLQATATGLPGPAATSYAPPSVRVTALGDTVALVPGGSALELDIPLVGSVSIAMPLPDSSASADGTSASASVSLLEISVRLLPILGVATANIDVLPMSASASAAAVPTAQLCIDDPVITQPADGSSVADATPTVSGTGEPAASIEVAIDGSSVGTTTVGADGTWSLEIASPLAAGPHDAVATQTIAGTTSTSEVRFSIDTAAPAAPVILEPADGSTIADATPTVTGTGEPGATVTIAFDGVDSGTAVVGDDGAWSFTPTAPLADGERTVTATQRDAAGNGSATDQHTFIVDTTALPPVIEQPANGSTTSDATPTIAGTGEPGATVSVSIDGSAVGTAVVAEDGSWSLGLTAPLADGEHLATALLTDSAGNVSPAASSAFTVDTAAPAAPVIEVPADGSVTADTTPTVSGTGEPGATVAVSIDGAAVGTAPVGDDGTWELALTDPLAEGAHLIEATQSDAAGNASGRDTARVVVDTTAPAAPRIDEPADGSVTSDTTPSISGTGEPGATVAVSIDGVPVGTAAVADDGTWSLALMTPLAEGEHTVGATQTDAAGNASLAAAHRFTIDLTAPAAPSIVAPEDGALIADATPTISGTGEPGAAVAVAIDGAPVGSVEVGDDGSWSLELTEQLSDGEHVVTATQQDRAGNRSGADTSRFTIDTTAPAAPVIDAPTDGSVTSDPTPTVSGRGEPGASIAVTVDGAPVGTATVADDGTWSLELTEPLIDGRHTIAAEQTDAAGNTSPSATVELTVDTSVDAPAIVAPADGERTSDATPTVSGTGEPGATVTVTVDGEPVGTAVVDEDGDWSLELDEPLSDGEHEIGASQRDPAGNESSQTVVSVTIDTTAPEAPAIVSPAEGEVVRDATPTIAGTGEPGATVVVVIDGQPAGIVVVREDGTWSLELAEPLADGRHVVGATQTDAAGNTSPASAVEFVVETGDSGEGPGDGDGGEGPGEGPGDGDGGEGPGEGPGDGDGGEGPGEGPGDGDGGEGPGEGPGDGDGGEGPGEGPGDGDGGEGPGAGGEGPGANGPGTGGAGSGSGGDRPGAGGTLPITGSETPTAVVMLGLLLLLGGVALTRARRRAA